MAPFSIKLGTPTIDIYALRTLKAEYSRICTHYLERPPFCFLKSFFFHELPRKGWPDTQWGASIIISCMAWGIDIHRDIRCYGYGTTPNEAFDVALSVALPFCLDPLNAPRNNDDEVERPRLNQ